MLDRSFTLYFHGDDPESALSGLPWDEWEGAEEARKDAGSAHVYSVTVVVDPSTIEVST